MSDQYRVTSNVAACGARNLSEYARRMRGVVTETPTGTDLPTHCEECGQLLLLRAPERTRCERCRMYPTHEPDEGTVREEPKAERPMPVPCNGCRRAVNEDGERVPLADGYCLLCRLDGKHLA